MKWNLFKRRKNKSEVEVKIKSSWDSVTIAEFQQYAGFNPQDFDSDVDAGCYLLSIFSNQGVDFWESCDYPYFLAQLQNLSFTKTVPESANLKSKYTIGKFKYKLGEGVKALKQCPISYLKTLQFVSIQKKYEATAAMEMLDQIKDMHNRLAIMLIPRGKKYGVEGYSVSENAENIRDNMSVTDALAVSAFFLDIWRGLMKVTEHSLECQIKKLKENKKVDQTMLNELEMTMKEISKINSEVIVQNGRGKATSRK